MGRANYALRCPRTREDPSDGTTDSRGAASRDAATERGQSGSKITNDLSRTAPSWTDVSRDCQSLRRQYQHGLAGSQTRQRTGQLSVGNKKAPSTTHRSLIVLLHLMDNVNVLDYRVIVALAPSKAAFVTLPSSWT